MNRMQRQLMTALQGLTVALALLCLPVLAQAAQLKEVRVWAGPDNTRVVMELTASPSYNSFTLENPNRLVIDLQNSQRAGGNYATIKGRGVVQEVRTGKRQGDNLRVVLDLSGATPSNIFVLPPTGKYGYRLVVDLGEGRAQQPDLDQRIAKAEPPPVQSGSDGDGIVKYVPKTTVIAIDAGHGGEDPGAHGPRGTKEKDVVLAVSKRLAKLINAAPHMKAVLTRDGDYYIGLRERMVKAREAKADLFVSIHADAFRDRSVRGASVYVLSTRGATSEHVRWLEKRENAADMVGGLSIRDKSKGLASFMLDLSQSASREASYDAAKRVLKHLDSIGRVHKGHVQRAAFVVLKSPDIPSMLVETAYITNPREERELRSASYQQKLARAIFAGIQGYFDDYRPGRIVAASD